MAKKSNQEVSKVAKKFSYNGDHKDMVAYGVDFSKGAAEVTDPFIIKKLSGNSHFDEVK